VTLTEFLKAISGDLSLLCDQRPDSPPKRVASAAVSRPFYESVHKLEPRAGFLIQPLSKRAFVALELAHGDGDALPQQMPVDIVLRQQRIGAQAGDDAGVAAMLGDEGAHGAPDIGFAVCHWAILDHPRAATTRDPPPEVAYSPLG
jgi:hypothetical protein